MDVKWLIMYSMNEGYWILIGKPKENYQKKKRKKIKTNASKHNRFKRKS